MWGGCPAFLLLDVLMALFIGNLILAGWLIIQERHSVPLGSREHHGDLELVRNNEMELMKLVLLGQGQNVHLSGALGTLP